MNNILQMYELKVGRSMGRKNEAGGINPSKPDDQQYSRNQKSKLFVPGI